MLTHLSRLFLAIAVGLTVALTATAEDAAPIPEPVETNVASFRWGAEVRGTGQPFNPSYDVDNVIDAGPQPALFGSKPKGLVGGMVTITLAMPVDIAAITFNQASQGGRFDRAREVALYVDGKRSNVFNLADEPNRPQRFPIQTHGQEFRFVITSQYDDPENDFGGWNEIEILTTTPVEMLFGLSPDYVPPTAALVQPSRRPVHVVGLPVAARGHPRTLWTTDELAAQRELVAQEGPAAQAVARLKAELDETLGEAVRLPAPQDAVDAPVWQRHMNYAREALNLAIASVLSGDSRYAKRAVAILSAYAARYEDYPLLNIGAPDQSRLFDRREDLATWLARSALAADLLYGAMTPSERKTVADRLLVPAARDLGGSADRRTARLPKSDALAAAAVLAVGCATDDAKLIESGLHGAGGVRGAADIIAADITEDGAWLGQPLSPPTAATEAIVLAAEIAWRNDHDLYSLAGARLKRLLDAPLDLAYPTYDIPPLATDGRETLLGPTLHVYDYALRRYGDPAYRLLADHVAPRLAVGPDDGVLPGLWRSDGGAPEPLQLRSSVLPGSGLAVLRVGAGPGASQLEFVYGTDAAAPRHDMLGFDLFGLRRPLMPCPGISRRNSDWYDSSIAHNTLTVDQRTQVPAPARLVLFGATADLAAVRAWTPDAFPGVAIDRTVVLTRDYLLDLTAVFSRRAHTYDLALHGFGRLDTSLKSDPFRFPRSPVRPAYAALSNVRSARADNIAWNATWREGGPTSPVALTLPPSPETTIITAVGRIGADDVPVLIQRRQAQSTAFASAVNLNRDPGFVTAMTWVDTGSPSSRAVLVETLRGSDLVVVNFSGKPVTAGDVRTDGALAIVRRRKPVRPDAPVGPVESLYLAGGTRLDIGSGAFTSSGGGFVAAERVENGNLLVQNLAGPETRLDITSLALPLGPRDADAPDVCRLIDEMGHPLADARPPSRTRRGATLDLSPGHAAEWGDMALSIFEQRAAVASERYRAALQSVQTDRLAAAERARRNAEEAARNPVTPGTVVVVEAEDFTGQGGGEVAVSDKKIASRGGRAFRQWDNEGHWLQWKVTVPESGYYHVILKSCSRDDRVRRRMEIDGRVPDPALEDFYLPETGGWSNTRDDWQMVLLNDFRVGQPVLVYLTRGEHAVRLVNISQSANLDYFAFASPDIPPERDEFE